MYVCYDCYVSSDNCQCCGESLLNKSFSTIPGTQGFFCKECIKNNPTCDRCNRPVVSDSILTSIDEGVSLCKNCVANSVINLEIGSNILVNIAQILRRVLRFEIPEDVPLYLVSKKEMEFIEGSAYSDKHGMKVPPGVMLKENQVHSIYILIGLPISRFISVLTHEYAHIWQSRKGIHNITSSLCEGFADWVAMKILFILGYQEEIRVIKERVNEYGAGLAKIMAVEKMRGFQGAVDYILNMERGQPLTDKIPYKRLSQTLVQS